MAIITEDEVRARYRYPFEHRELYENGPFTGNGAYVCSQVSLDASESYLLNFIGVDKFDDGLHCTIMYSSKRKCSPGLADHVLPALVATAPIVALDYWDGHDDEGYIVAKLDSPLMNERNAFWTNKGLQHSFPDYTAHVTLLHGEPAKALKNAMPDTIRIFADQRTKPKVVLFHEHISDCRGFGK